MTDYEAKAREIYKDVREFIIPHGEAEAFVERRITAALREAYAAGVEDAARVCVEHADGYHRLQSSARGDQDAESALAHLCSKDSALGCAREIRALSPERREEGEGKR